MANINWVQDYAVPAGVGVGELALKAVDRSRLIKNPNAMEYEPLLPYAIGIGGTAARLARFGQRHDDSIKMAVAASIPRIVTGVYDWATVAVGSRTARSVRARRVSSSARAEAGVANAPPRGDGSGYLSI